MVLLSAQELVDLEDVVRASVGSASKVTSKHGDHDWVCCPSSLPSSQKLSLARMGRENLPCVHALLSS